MMLAIEELLEQHRLWLKEKTYLKTVGDWFEITTPYLDRNNDYIQIYARREGSAWLLSDDGYTLGDLSLSGYDVNAKGTRKQIFATILNGFGVKLGAHDELTVSASDADFPFKKQSLIQAVLGVGDLFYLSRTRVASIFAEDEL